MCREEYVWLKCIGFWSIAAVYWWGVRVCLCIHICSILMGVCMLVYVSAMYWWRVCDVGILLQCIGVCVILGCGCSVYVCIVLAKCVYDCVRLKWVSVCVCVYIYNE